MGLDPSIFGQIGAGVRSVADYDQQAQGIQANRLHQMLLQHQISQLPVQDQMQQLQLDQQRIGNQKANALFQLLNGTDASGGMSGPMATASGALGAGAQAGSVGPTVANGARMDAMPPQQTASANGAPLFMGHTADTWGRIKALGGPDQSSFIKLLAEGAAAPPGSEVTDLRTGQKHTVMTLKPGQQVAADGGVDYAPRFVSGEASLTGATKGAELGAANRLTLAPDSLVGRMANPGVYSIEDVLASRGAQPQGLPPQGVPPQGAAPPDGGLPINAAGHPFVPPNVQASRDATAAQVQATEPPVAALPPRSAASQAADVSMIRQELAKPGTTPAQRSILQGELAKAQARTGDFNGMQAQLDAAKNAGGDEYAQFLTQHIQDIQKIQDPAQRQQALAGFTSHISTPAGTPIHPSVTMPAATAGGLSLLSDAQLAAKKEHAIADVKLQTAPAIAAATATAEGGAKQTLSYRDELNTGVDAMYKLQERNQQLKPYLEKFQTGGLLPDQRLAVANSIQNTGFLSEGLKTKIAAWVSNGDPTAGKQIAYSLGSEGIQNMLQTLEGSGAKPNRAEFVAMNKVKLGLDSGNLSIQEAMQQQRNVYNSLLAEQQALATARENGTYADATWRERYAAQRDKALFSGGTTPAGTPIVTAPGKGPMSATTSGGVFKYLGKQ